MASPELYAAVIWELRKQIMARGLTMQECDDLSGNQDGHTAKLLHPETKSGRQGDWETLERLAIAVYGRGFKLRMASAKPIMLSGPSTIEKMAGRNPTGRIAIRDFARFAGQRGAKARNASLKPEQRSKIARKAARARWQRSKLAAHDGTSA